MRNRLELDQWWAVVHAHNRQPLRLAGGQAAIYELRRQAEAARRAHAETLGPRAVHVRKVRVTAPPPKGAAAC